MVNGRPTLDITSSTRSPVQAQVDKVYSHSIQSARYQVAQLDDLHRIESDTARSEFIDSFLGDNKYLSAVAERV